MVSTAAPVQATRASKFWLILFGLLVVLVWWRWPSFWGASGVCGLRVEPGPIDGEVQLYRPRQAEEPWRVVPHHEPVAVPCGEELELGYISSAPIAAASIAAAELVARSEPSAAPSIRIQPNSAAAAPSARPGPAWERAPKRVSSEVLERRSVGDSGELRVKIPPSELIVGDVVTIVLH